MSDRTVKLLKTSINIGKLASFENNANGSLAIDDHGIRKVSYYQDDVTDNFPLLYAQGRLTECNEINLFLIQRFLGDYSLRKNRQVMSEFAWSNGYISSLKGEPIDISTVLGIAKDLKAFFQFLVAHDFNYLEVIAAPLAKMSSCDSVAKLPIWQYQSHLCERVKSHGSDRLSWGVAKRRLCRVREFYMWSYKRGVINALPFSVVLKQIGKTKKASAEDMLFTVPTSASINNSKGMAVWVSNLSIPNKLKQKADRNKGLQPYNAEELTSLLSTNIAQDGGTYSLFLKCAYLGGFRSFETIQINHEDTTNPDLNEKNSRVYKLTIVRKHHSPKIMNITSTLMSNLYAYTQTDTWINRRKKHEIKYGINNPEQPLPLFINSSGERMARTTASDSIARVRKEQREKSIPVLARNYHDLRSTFGTYLAMYLIDKHAEIKRVRSELRKWMGHEEFSTTESYIDFAKASDPSEYGAMHDWVFDVYTHVELLKSKSEKEQL